LDPPPAENHVVWATDGFVTVTTPTGSLQSNKPFVVIL